MNAPKLTPPRLRALAVLSSQARSGGYARYSNETNERAGNVYWQSANWLVENEFAYYPSGSTYLALTDAGRALAREHGLACEHGA